MTEPRNRPYRYSTLERNTILKEGRPTKDVIGPWHFERLRKPCYFETDLNQKLVGAPKCSETGLPGCGQLFVATFCARAIPLKVRGVSRGKGDFPQLQVDLSLVCPPKASLGPCAVPGQACRRVAGLHAKRAARNPESIAGKSPEVDGSG